MQHIAVIAKGNSCGGCNLININVLVKVHNILAFRVHLHTQFIQFNSTNTHSRETLDLPMSETKAHIIEKRIIHRGFPV